jgi:hypothetical protein
LRKIREADVLNADVLNKPIPDEIAKRDDDGGWQVACRLTSPKAGGRMIAIARGDGVKDRTPQLTVTLAR